MNSIWEIKTRDSHDWIKWSESYSVALNLITIFLTKKFIKIAQWISNERGGWLPFQDEVSVRVCVNCALNRKTLIESKMSICLAGCTFKLWLELTLRYYVSLSGEIVYWLWIRFAVTLELNPLSLVCAH